MGTVARWGNITVVETNFEPSLEQGNTCLLVVRRAIRTSMAFWILLPLRGNGFFAGCKTVTSKHSTNQVFSSRPMCFHTLPAIAVEILWAGAPLRRAGCLKPDHKK